jgi:hypothetical protein
LPLVTSLAQTDSQTDRQSKKSEADLAAGDEPCTDRQPDRQSKKSEADLAAGDEDRRDHLV